MKNNFYRWKNTFQLLLFTFLLLSSNAVIAQLSLGGSPISFSQKLQRNNVDVKVMPGIDLTKLRAEDQVNDTRKMPYRIAVPMPVSYSLNNSGTWESLDNGDRIWRLNISCPDAKAISLLYSDFHMPPGALLYLYNEDKSHILGAFSEQNNKPIRQFATALLHGDFMILEYFEPAKSRGQGALTISQVGHVYRGVGEDNASLGNSGNCQVDVNCVPEGNNWQDEKKGVAKILINGSGLCTGSLINNVEQDCRPLFLTADHCLGNVDAIANPAAPGWVFYWNFERTGCANTLDPVDDSQTTSGATLLANAGQEINNDPASDASDFALFLLDENPQGAYDVYFNGFDASGATGTGGAGIHHPAGDAKKIATHSLTPASVVNNNYWRILPWDVTANGQSVTEGGSSGSPLFNSAGNIIGQLFGGFAGGQPNCSDPGNDEGDYGRLDVSWNFGATATRRLSDHLDPNGTGTMIVSGMNQCCQLVVNCALITDQTISCRADLPPVDFDLPIIVSSCGDVILSALTIIPGDSGCPGDEITITRTYFIQDDDGNMDQCMQTFTVISNVAPTIACPAGGIVECAADIVVNVADATATSECGTPSVSLSGPVINGTPDCPGTTYTYTYTVTDDCNRMASCEQVFTIANDPPTIVCPADMIVECSADIMVSAANATVTTSCTLGSNTVVSGPVQVGKPDCPGTTYTYTYTVTDDCGRMASCEQVFTIQNNAPVVVCPADEVVQCFEDIVVDPNNLTVTTSCGMGFFAYVKQPLIAGGIPGCDGTVYTYIYVVVDDCGRRVECEQQFLIQNDAPMVTVPAGGTVTCFSDIQVSPSDATVVTDCPSDTYVVNVLNPVLSGPKDCPGTTYTYTYRVKDNCNRIVEVERVFTNGQNAGPSITAPADGTVNCLGSANTNPDYATVVSSCGEGSYTVEVTGPQIFGPQDCPGTRYVYTYTVTDECGRMDSDTRVLVVSNEGPEFVSCEEDQWLQFNCEDYGGEQGTIAAIQAYIASVQAYSACGDQLTVFNNFNSNNINTCINNGINTITFRATDNCGRSSFCTTTYVVVDTEAPMIIEDAQDHWEICNYNTPWNFQQWVANHGGAEAYDGCSNENVFWSTIPANPTFNCMGAMGVTSETVTFVVRDNCGNSTSTTATFNAFMGGGNDLVGNDLPDVAAESKTGALELLQNKPNPFKGETTIGFNLPTSQDASLMIYDLSGKLLKTVQGNYVAGYNEIIINRNALPSTGVLIYRLVTATESATRKMILLK